MVAILAALLLGQLFCFCICYHKLLRNLRNQKVVSVGLSQLAIPIIVNAYSMGHQYLKKNR
jgi:hypothetical protein